MNAVEIEEAVSALADAPFNAETFPYDFLQAFGLNDAGIRKLKSGDTNKSDLRDGQWKWGVLQRNKNNIHLLTCPPGEVAAAMDALRNSPATAKHKARFILATDGNMIQAERFDDGELLPCDFKQLPDRFTFFLSLAGISTVKRIDENAFDIRATGRLNKLYVELLKENPAWDTEARRQHLNHFFARLIFCFFAEDTNIFTGGQLFTETVDQMTERNGSNVHEVLSEIFRAMDTRREDRATTDLRPSGSARKLLNLRNRLARIRVFDPACGSGNFLVIAYKEMRAIEAHINERRGELDINSAIPISNFRGIELRSFPAEIARLALIIAEFQCDVLYRGELLARNEFLPLVKENWIVCGNALRLDWLTVCPPTGTGVRVSGDDLFNTPLDQAEIDFENAGGETYICGNPPYSGKGKLDSGQKSDMVATFEGRTKHWGYIDYVGAWFVKAADYCRRTDAAAALVSTNSIVMGRQAPTLWPVVLSEGVRIRFAHTSFAWSNNAAHNAAVFCVIVGIVFALSSDYKVTEEETHRFFAEVQNKLLFAATGNTAAEIVVKRSDPGRPNMNLTTWDGKRVRKQDVIVAKNYLTADEVDTLNRLVVIFLEQAELRVKDRKDLTLDFWCDNVDKMLAFNDRAVLQGPGKISHDDMKAIAHQRYDAFDANRRAAEAIEADAEDLKQIEDLNEKLKRKKKKP